MSSPTIDDINNNGTNTDNLLGTQHVGSMFADLDALENALENAKAELEDTQTTSNAAAAALRYEIEALKEENDVQELTRCLHKVTTAKLQQQLKDENDALKDALDAQKLITCQQNVDMATTQDTMQAETAELMQQVKALAAELEDTQRKLFFSISTDTFTDYTATIERAWNQMLKEQPQLKHENDALKDALDAQKLITCQQNVDMATTQDTMQAETAELMQQVKALAAELEDTKAAAADLQHEIYVLKDALDAQELTTCLEKVTTATTQDTMKAEKAELMQQVQTLAAELEGTKAELARGFDHSPGPRCHSESPNYGSWSPRSPGGSRSLTAVDTALKSLSEQIETLKDQLQRETEQSAKQVEHCEVIKATLRWSIAELTKQVAHQKDTIGELKQNDISLADTVIEITQELQSSNVLVAVLTEEVEHQKGVGDEMALEVIALQAMITDLQENDRVVEIIAAEATAKLKERDDQHTRMCALAAKAQTRIHLLEDENKTIKETCGAIALMADANETLVTNLRSELQAARDTARTIAVATAANDASNAQILCDLERELQAKTVLLQEAEDTSSAITVAAADLGARNEQIRCDLERELQAKTVLLQETKDTSNDIISRNERIIYDLRTNLEELAKPKVEFQETKASSVSSIPESGFDALVYQMKAFNESNI